MNDKIRKSICVLSTAFIIGLYIFKGLPSFFSASISDSLSMLFTSLIVTGVKAGIICGVIVMGNKIINKLKLNSEKRQNNRENFKIKNNNVKIKEKVIEVKYESRKDR